MHPSVTACSKLGTITATAQQGVVSTTASKAQDLNPAAFT